MSGACHLLPQDIGRVLLLIAVTLCSRPVLGKGRGRAGKERDVGEKKRTPALKMTFCILCGHWWAQKAMPNLFKFNSQNITIDETTGKGTCGFTFHFCLRIYIEI